MRDLLICYRRLEGVARSVAAASLQDLPASSITGVASSAP